MQFIVLNPPLKLRHMDSDQLELSLVRTRGMLCFLCFGLLTELFKQVLLSSHASFSIV